ncbi:MAG TPA: hypothetical protein VF628_11070 [Allosphingosinicella sp.]|jgi:hypothetical protein
MSLDANLLALLTAVGGDVKSLRLADGDLSQLATTAKNNLVAAINEVYGMVGSAGAAINDTAGDGATAVTWSANKIYDSIEAARVALRDELRAGAGAALDTFAEVAAALAADDTAAAALADAVAKRIRFDAAQVLQDTEKVQARSNIGAASAADLTALTTAVGNTEQDLVAAYNLAKA